MCGLMGLWNRHKSVDQSLNHFGSMVDALKHRGPDDSGIHVEQSANLLLGHTRLAIQDLTAGGKQPMVSRNGRYLMVFNGEIYNHLQLRETFSRFIWRGTSDTETLLECISTYGIDRSLNLFRGMFAFGLYDRREKLLILARDRFGEKPMYYGFLDHRSNSFFFGSDVSPLKKHPDFQKKISDESIKAYLEYGYVPTPLSIYEGIFKLSPGAMISVNLAEGNCVVGREKRWFDCFETASRGNCYSPDSNLLPQIERRLVDAVRSQSVADVRLGTFLSGGIDSSLITAIFARDYGDSVEAFTVGFKDTKNDESAMANAIANHLGIRHSIIPFEDYDLIGLADNMGHIYGEPFADSSQLPTHLVSAVAKQSVSVVLTGDGGDEIFGGYNRYVFVPKLLKYSRLVPSILPSLGLKAIDAPLLRKMLSVLSRYTKVPDDLDKIRKVVRVLGSQDLAEAYSRLTVLHPRVFQGAYDSSSRQTALQQKTISSSTDLRSMMDWDINSYLPDDILFKVDRASMASGLETRAPYLDADLTTFMATLPDNCLIRDGKSKWILRELLKKYVPEKLFAQPKKGFGIPLDDLLRNDLRSWGFRLLTSSSLKSLQVLNETRVYDLWLKHQAGESHGHRLWSILMLSNWLESNEFT